MKTLKKGDKVYISTKSKYVSQGFDRGVEMIGKIIHFRQYEEHAYLVKWENGDTNSYRKQDLISANKVEINIHR